MLRQSRRAKSALGMHACPAAALLENAVDTMLPNTLRRRFVSAEETTLYNAKVAHLKHGYLIAAHRLAERRAREAGGSALADVQLVVVTRPDIR